MGFLPFLAFAGLSGGAVDEINQFGWFLPFLALFIPVTLILFFLFAKLSYLAFATAQAATIICGLRVLISHLRHRGFSRFQVRLMLIPCYLVACFATNIAALIGVGLIRKLF